jgi:glucose/arabinose dehydrogenase
MKRSIAWLSVFVWGGAAASVSAQTDQHAEGRALYRKSCANCHGALLEGGMASSLVDGQWAFGDERDALFRNIHDGIADRGMPAFGRVLTRAQIDAMIDFVLAAVPEAQKAPEIPDSFATLDYAVKVERFVEGLEIPWAIDFIDAKTALVTERPGRLRVVENGRLRPEPVLDVPAVIHEGQGGMLDVAVDPEYAQNGWLYLGYSHELKDAPADANGRRPAMTRVVRGKLAGNRWVDTQVVFEAPHDTYNNTRHHFGTRIVFDREGRLYFSIGDRGRDTQAQELERPNGKIHRVNRDGTLPKDNPFLGRKGALPSIFSYGHRNPQGLAFHPETGRLWDVEHGPRGGDELNVITKAANYGWPLITYGIHYDGRIITDEKARPGLESPIYYWRPSLGIGGLDFYRGDLFPKWKGKALVTALNFREVQLLDIIGERVLHAEVIGKGIGRIREAVTGPDGAIYVVLNRPDAIVRLTPLPAPAAASSSAGSSR